MKLRLFTANYPYGFGESFINNELPYLAKAFDSTIIYPYKEVGTIQTAFKNEGEIKMVNDKEAQVTLNLSDKILVLVILMAEITKAKQRFFILKKLRRFYALAKNGVKLSKWLEQDGLNPNDAYYSFWMNEWALALAILKKKGKIKNFAFRVNGYDIHDERNDGNYLPFRRFIYKYTAKVYPLSKTSRDYIKSLNVYPEKIEAQYFGTKDFGEAARREDDRYHIFSCSSAIPLKRIEKMAEIVSLLKFPVKWVHHGGGPTIEKVKEIMNKAPDHIEFVNTQKLEDYHAVLEMERQLRPDLFMNLSTSEGLPVAVMEAMSFGTPILVNDVGSCKEFINDITGILVGPDAAPSTIAREITRLYESNKSETDRDAIRKFWYENFSAEENYSKFAGTLKQLFK